jgi:tRNA threonylcarbamoyladenosine biosynthesis protein TsaB
LTLNLLAFDTSTERMSLAVRAGLDGTVHSFEGGGGAQTSATLIPAIQDLLARAGLRLAQLDAIVFGRGPGSFTGLRTACSVAQGLGFGSGVPVLAVDTLLAVAEEARAHRGMEQVVAVLDARMEEVYWAHYGWNAGGWAALGGPWLGAPEAVVVPAGAVLAGNALAQHATRLPGAPQRVEAWPTAAALLRLAPALLTAGLAGPAAQALPLYVRDKVAQTTVERAAHRARPS